MNKKALGISIIGIVAIFGIIINLFKSEPSQENSLGQQIL
jgi:hypothetical protein